MSKNSIKELRKTLGLSQKELGEKVGVDRSTVSAWERGVTVPKGEIADNLQAVFEDCPPPPECTENNSIRKKNARYKLQEEAAKRMTESMKAIHRTFTEGNLYTISESQIQADGNILQQSILRYERKEGIHHVFREIRGKWIVTYTDAQLVGKIVKEVNINGNGNSLS